MNIKVAVIILQPLFELKIKSIVLISLTTEHIQ